MIKPALTDEQWEQMEKGAFGAGEFTMHLWDSGHWVQVVAAANRLLPDDDPHKFTWADYDLWNGRNPEAQIIADKIRAILPPREVSRSTG